MELGWSKIEVIDDDLGRSAAGGVQRAGFERMVAEVCFSVRSARSCRRGRSRASPATAGIWQQLIEMCRVVDTVLVDQETVYAPRHGNDRLLLGLKGSLNEYELDLLRQRSLSARHEKARRGELVVAAPVGPKRSASLGPVAWRGTHKRAPENGLAFIVAHQCQALGAFAEVDGLRHHHHTDRTRRTDHAPAFKAPSTAATATAWFSTPRPTRTVTPIDLNVDDAHGIARAAASRASGSRIQHRRYELRCFRISARRLRLTRLSSKSSQENEEQRSCCGSLCR